MLWIPINIIFSRALLTLLYHYSQWFVWFGERDICDILLCNHSVQRNVWCNIEHFLFRFSRTNIFRSIWGMFFQTRVKFNEHGFTKYLRLTEMYDTYRRKLRMRFFFFFFYISTCNPRVSSPAICPGQSTVFYVPRSIRGGNYSHAQFREFFALTTATNFQRHGSNDNRGIWESVSPILQYSAAGESAGFCVFTLHRLYCLAETNCILQSNHSSEGITDP